MYQAGNTTENDLGAIVSNTVSSHSKMGDIHTSEVDEKLAR
jgi:hypothetical protein